MNHGVVVVVTATILKIVKCDLTYLLLIYRRGPRNSKNSWKPNAQRDTGYDVFSGLFIT